MQHADHFTRILNERESFKREKSLEDRLDNKTNNLSEINDSSEQALEKDAVDTSGDEVKISKSEKSQVEIN